MLFLTSFIFLEYYLYDTVKNTPMKTIIYILSLLITPFVFSQKAAFQYGEHLEYKLSYSNFLTAGYATMDISKAHHQGKDAFHVVGKGKTTGMINWFFKVKDNYETYMDKDSELPYRFIRQINEGGYTKDKEIKFNQSLQKATVYNKETHKSKVFSMEMQAQDLLSSLYYMRNRDISHFKKNDEITLPIFLDEEMMHMKLRFLGRETIDTKFGKIKTAKFMPLVESDRIFKEKESVTVWVSDDLNKIPVRIKASLAVGSLRADLYKYNGLLHTITFE